jgi:RNA polymerase sigma factor (sigma-70 family)
MAIHPINNVFQHIRKVALPDGNRPTDGQLLGSFVDDRNQAAFAELVERLGPMVWGVCRRLLDHHDAEDAFQAAFLVLFRKAAGVQPRQMIANWLYGVAHQAALEARRSAARRRAREMRMIELTRPQATEAELWSDLQPLLDRELSALPSNYRCVVLLCDVEGKTRMEAARQLGLPEGTVASRLARAREMLATRLTRRGVTVSGGMLAATLSQVAASASVPAALVSSTIGPANALLIGQAALSENVAHLTEHLLKSIVQPRLKAAFLMAALALSSVIVAFAAQSSPVNPADSPAKAADHNGGPPKEKPVDSLVDALPERAVSRLGTLRFRGTATIDQIVVVPGGKQLLALSRYDAISLWDAATGAEIRRFEAPRSRTAEDGYTAAAWIQSFALSPDGKTLAMGINDNSNSKFGCPIILFDFATGDKLGDWLAPRKNLRSPTNGCLTFLTPKLLASVNADAVVYLWDVTRRREVRQLQLSKELERFDLSNVTLASTTDGKNLFIFSGDEARSEWKAWEASTGRVVREQSVNPDRFASFAISADGSRLPCAESPYRFGAANTTPTWRFSRVRSGTCNGPGGRMKGPFQFRVGWHSPRMAR